MSIDHNYNPDVKTQLEWIELLGPSCTPSGFDFSKLDLSFMDEGFRKDSSIVTPIFIELGNIRRLVNADPDTAIEKTLELYNLHRDSGGVTHMAAKILRKAGKHDIALSIVEKTMQRGFDASFLELFIELSSQLGQYEKVAWGVRVMSQRYPEKLDTLEIFLRKHNVLPKLENTETPPIHKFSQIKDTPNSNENNLVEYKLRKLCSIQGELTLKNEILQEVKQLQKRSLNLIIIALRMAIHLKRYEDAMFFAKEGMNLAPRDNGKFHKLASFVQLVLGNEKQALELAKTAAARDNKEASNVSGLEAAIKLGKFDDALLFAEALCLTHPKTDIALRFMGAHCFQKGDFIKAREYLSRLADLGINIMDRCSMIILICLDVMATDFSQAIKRAHSLRNSKSSYQFSKFAQTFISLIENEAMNEPQPMTPKEFFDVCISSVTDSIQALDIILLARASGEFEDSHLQKFALIHLKKLAQERQRNASISSEDTDFSTQSHSVLRLRTSTFFDNAHRLRPRDGTASAVLGSAQVKGGKRPTIL